MSGKSSSIFIGALVVGILSTSYLSMINMLCCLGVMIGGATAVWHYTSTNELTIMSGEGAGLGALAGLLGGLIGFALDQTMGLFGMGSQQVTQGLWEGFMDPAQLEAMKEQQSQYAEGGMKYVGALIGMAFGAIFGAVGGAIGASMFKKGTTVDEY